MKENESIECSVNDCRHYHDEYCTLDKIQVAHCDENKVKVKKGNKEATMCDSYDKKKAM